LIDFPTHTIVRDEQYRLEAILAKDLIVVDGHGHVVPGRGSL